MLYNRRIRIILSVDHFIRSCSLVLNNFLIVFTLNFFTHFKNLIGVIALY